MRLDDEPTTEELRAVQSAKAEEESKRADEAELPDEEHEHARRADKASYLRSKLDEQARSEDP